MSGMWRKRHASRSRHTPVQVMLEGAALILVSATAVQQDISAWRFLLTATMTMWKSDVCVVSAWWAECRRVRALVPVLCTSSILLRLLGCEALGTRIGPSRLRGRGCLMLWLNGNRQLSRHLAALGLVGAPVARFGHGICGIITQQWWPLEVQVRMGLAQTRRLLKHLRISHARTSAPIGRRIFWQAREDVSGERGLSSNAGDPRDRARMVKYQATEAILEGRSLI